MSKLIKRILIVSLVCTFSLSLSLRAEEQNQSSLFERLGGEAAAHKIVADIWTNHTQNPIVKDRFANSDPVYVKSRVYEIFASATGANVEYKGKDMKTAHHAMNISEMEFNAVVDDVMAALNKHSVGQQEKNEVLAILWSVRPDIVNSNLLTNTLTTDNENSQGN